MRALRCKEYVEEVREREGKEGGYFFMKVMEQDVCPLGLVSVKTLALPN